MVARNDGARFPSPLLALGRSENDVVLALTSEPAGDIPRQCLPAVDRAGLDEVKARLWRQIRAAGNQHVVTGVTGELHTKFGPATRDISPPGGSSRI